MFVVDRLKDMVVSGGENVYSAEVERVIETYPKVAEVAVFGVPDADWGEVVVAAVVPAAGEEVDGEEIRRYLRGRIAGYKIPRRVFVRRDPLPVSGTNKIQKRELRPYYGGSDSEEQST